MTVTRIHRPSSSVYYSLVAMCGDLWAFFKHGSGRNPFYLLSPSHQAKGTLEAVGQLTQAVTLHRGHWFVLERTVRRHLKSAAAAGQTDNTITSVTQSGLMTFYAPQQSWKLQMQISRALTGGGEITDVLPRRVCAVYRSNKLCLITSAAHSLQRTCGLALQVQGRTDPVCFYSYEAFITSPKHFLISQFKNQ